MAKFSIQPILYAPLSGHILWQVFIARAPIANESGVALAKQGKR